MAAAAAVIRKSQRGSASIETAGVLLCVFLTLTAALFVAYVVFAMAWIRYQSEQGLYCVAEGHLEFRCARQVENELKAFLPQLWTRRLEVNLISTGEQKWRSKVIWKTKEIKPFLKPFFLQVKRELSIGAIRRDRKDLRWSRRSR